MNLASLSLLGRAAVVQVAPSDSSSHAGMRAPAACECARRAGPGAPRHRRAFTLLEILLALALIGLLGAVLVGGGANLLSERALSADEVFWKAVQECRKRALKGEKDIRLTFQAKEKKFVLADASGADATTKDFSVPAANDLEITFLTTQKGASMIMLGGVAVETQTLSFVTFYSDGTCTPFRLQIQQGAGTRTIAIDPWTCAQVLTPADANASAR